MSVFNSHAQSWKWRILTENVFLEHVVFMHVCGCMSVWRYACAHVCMRSCTCMWRSEVHVASLQTLFLMHRDRASQLNPELADVGSPASRLAPWLELKTPNLHMGARNLSSEHRWTFVGTAGPPSVSWGSCLSSHLGLDVGAHLSSTSLNYQVPTNHRQFNLW